jgi:hypothetical protein
MHLSAPVHRLKRDARLLSRRENIPLHEALDRLAAQEGFSGWSLLAARAAAVSPAAKFYARLAPGDMALVAARPGQGKTRMGLALAVAAMQEGRQAAFFSLEYIERDMQGCFDAIGAERARFGGLFTFDCSDAISAAYIMERLAAAPRGTLAAVDYLQLLDQKRENPPLMEQVRALRAFARAQGVVLVFLSQVDRSYDPALKPYPGLADVRLPNPLDLALFDHACFLNNGAARFEAAA